jgi:hypothetical protein
MLPAFSVQFAPWDVFCMTTGGMHDNGGPALWSRHCRHTDFTRRQAPARKWLNDGLVNPALPGARAWGNLTTRHCATSFPVGLPSSPLQQPVSALEGLHTTLKGTGAAKRPRSGLIAGVPGFRTAWVPVESLIGNWRDADIRGLISSRSPNGRNISGSSNLNNPTASGRGVNYD